MQDATQRAGVSLRELFSRGRFFGSEDIRVTSTCCDWRQVKPGDLFVAILGDETDGHDYFSEAVRRGARAVLAERLLPVDVPQCLVRDTRVAHGSLCQALAGHPARNMRVVGVTGTHGKTITSCLISSMLDAAEYRVGVTNSIGYCDSVHTETADQTTPDAPKMARLLSQMVANRCGASVLELSSRALAQRQTAGLRLDAAVLTNVRSNHLDLHSTTQNYRKAKSRIFNHLKKHGVAVLNADDPGSRPFLSKLESPVITIGMREQAEVTASVIERHAWEQVFLLTAGHESIPVRTQLTGDHNIYNCLSAAAVGLVMGIDLPTIARGLEAVDSLPGRLQRVECGQSFRVFVDQGQTPDALAVALKSVRQVTQGRVVCVFGGPYGVNAEQRPLLGRVLERSADKAILTGAPGMRAEESLPEIHELLDGYDRPARAHVMPDREAAIHWALEHAQEGDAILLAGQGVQDADTARTMLYAAASEEGPTILPFPQTRAA